MKAQEILDEIEREEKEKKEIDWDSLKEKLGERKLLVSYNLKGGK